MLDEEIREVKEGGIKSFDALDSREKTIAILGVWWWPQTAKQDADKIICKRFLYNVWKKRNEHLNVEDVFIKSRNEQYIREIENRFFFRTGHPRGPKSIF